MFTFIILYFLNLVLDYPLQGTFLAEYKWVENWARGVRENYFPITIEEFLSKVPNNYVIDYFYEFIMPQTQQGILKDFNILLKDTTHFKCILRKI